MMSLEGLLGLEVFSFSSLPVWLAIAMFASLSSLPEVLESPCALILFHAMSRVR